jgi:hypothetical protein
VVGFQVRKPHLDLLALVARLVELRRAHQGACNIAFFLVNIARLRGLSGARDEFHLAARAAVARNPLSRKTPLRIKTRSGGPAHRSEHVPAIGEGSYGPLVRLPRCCGRLRGRPATRSAIDR